MNNRQRDAAAMAFRQVADELDGAKALAEKKANVHADAAGVSGETRRLFVERFVEGWCIDQLARGAERIRSIVEVYLTTPPPASRTRRGRR